MLMKKLAGGAALCVLAFAATGAFAQEITGGIAGTVTENGKPIGGAAVKVTNPGTGQSFTTTSGPDGFYTVRNLQPGGPYNITVTAPDKQTASDIVGQVPIGAPVQLDMPVGATASEVTVTASPIVRNLTIATGPRTIITSRDIQELPSFARDLHDLVRLNPFVTIDEANSNSLIIAGNNNHFNTIYLDGVRQSDDFGLNNNGYPTQRTPFSLSVIQSLNLEVAPYDVQYGDFEGGILNVVTKSGSNDFHGSVQYEYDSNSESGKFIGPDAIYAGIEGLKPANAQPRHVTTTFTDQDSQVTIGGPIVPDRVFFFFGYDRFQGTGASSFVPQDVAGANPIPGVLQSDVTNVQNIFKAAAPGGYNYDPLNFGGSAPVLNTEYFAKLDWYINDKQHFWFSYQNTQGTQYNTPDGSVSFKELNLASSDYVQAQNLIAYTADLTSNWTQSLATEIEYTYRSVDSPTEIVGAPFANVLIQLANGSEIDLGPDISRQANNLGVTDQQARFRAHYTIGDNVITAGYEWEQLAEFDLFVQDATGAYTFSNGCGPGFGLSNGASVNLMDHVACRLTYQNAFDNNPNTAAGTAYDYTNTLYAEDEWHPLPDLTITGGLRAEFYSSPSKPLLNPRFVTQYGFANNGTIDGEYIVMPRAGFNWRPDPGLTVTGGFGLFSGGNPGVYAYDSFDNPGNLLGTKTYSCNTANCATQSTALTAAGTSALTNVTGSTIPLTVQQDITASANLGTGNANALDPHFKPPSEWKASLSVVQLVDFNEYRDSKWGKYTDWLGDGWRFHGDLLGQKTQDAVTWEDLWEEQYQLTPAQATQLGLPSNVAPDGRPLFNPNRYICGAPSPTQPAGASPVCNVFGVPVNGAGVPTGVKNTSRTSGNDILLTDTHQGDALIFAIGVEKSFKWGLDIDYTYTHQNVHDVNPATSSVANSNYINNITTDPNHPALSTSNYQILYENRVSITYQHKWLGDNNTTIRLFLYNRAGLPFSYAFCPTASSTCQSPSISANFDELFGQSSSSTMHQLLYVPKTDAAGLVTATSDPKVTFGPSFDLNGFNAFLRSSGLLKYAGQIAPRNAFRSSDVNTGDVQFAQEVPALFPHGAKGEVYLDIINVLNMLNRNWGIDNQVGFPYVFAPVAAINCQFSGKVLDNVAMPVCAKGQGNFYQFNSFRPQVTSSGANQFSTIQTLANPPVPTWVLKFGIRYKF
jgi:Carboxypeptidase regulatory-like domain/TonB-dependent Receptor Plug Domain/TonB dependent receptor